MKPFFATLFLTAALVFNASAQFLDLTNTAGLVRIIPYTSLWSQTLLTSQGGAAAVSFIFSDTNAASAFLNSITNAPFLSLGNINSTNANFQNLFTANDQNSRIIQTNIYQLGSSNTGQYFMPGVWGSVVLPPGKYKSEIYLFATNATSGGVTGYIDLQGSDTFAGSYMRGDESAGPSRWDYAPFAGAHIIQLYSTAALGGLAQSSGILTVTATNTYKLEFESITAQALYYPGLSPLSCWYLRKIQ